MVRASSSIRRTASAVEISGRLAPSRVRTPIPIRANTERPSGRSPMTFSVWAINGVGSKTTSVCRRPHPLLQIAPPSGARSFSFGRLALSPEYLPLESGGV